MNTEGILSEAAQALSDSGVASPRHDAEMLLSHVVRIPRTKLSLGAEVSDQQRAAFDELVVRRAAREPVQHLIGTAAFRFVELAVGPGVFIPRPETELLAGWVIDHAKQLDRPVVVDLCTGSGAVALSITDEVPGARVHAVELDGNAHDWARRNLDGRDVDLRHGDMSDAFGDLDGTVDIVVSNPPYIPLEAWESVEIEVRDHDPELALWSGDDGLDALRAVERSARRLLKAGGVVASEHADVQGESAIAIFSDARVWNGTLDHVDYAQRPRFVTATKN